MIHDFSSSCFHSVSQFCWVCYHFGKNKSTKTTPGRICSCDLGKNIVFYFCNKVVLVLVFFGDNNSPSEVVGLIQIRDCDGDGCGSDYDCYNEVLMNLGFGVTK